MGKGVPSKECVLSDWCCEVVFQDYQVFHRDAHEEKGSSALGSSINVDEVLKFEEMAKEWWDPEGSSAPLHSMNPVRTKFTRDALCLCFG